MIVGSLRRGAAAVQPYACEGLERPCWVGASQDDDVDTRNAVGVRCRAAVLGDDVRGDPIDRPRRRRVPHRWQLPEARADAAEAPRRDSSAGLPAGRILTGELEMERELRIRFSLPTLVQLATGWRKVVSAQSWFQSDLK